MDLTFDLSCVKSSSDMLLCEPSLTLPPLCCCSSVLMNLESTAVICEDIGRQVLTYGHRKEVSEFINAIKAVTPADISAVVTKMLKTPPTLTSHGNTAGIPRYDALCKRF